MASNAVLPDYYAVLQVRPDADPEVIEAAYRQLMKKHHPDKAGTDPRKLAEHHARSKAINEAFAVLRQPETRSRYDIERQIVGTRRPPTWTSSATAAPPRARAAPPPPPTNASTSGPRHASPAPPPPPSPGATADVEVDPGAYEPASGSPWLTLLAPVSSLYYLLPGPYEWEPASRSELRSIVLAPPIGVTAFALATGRLAPLLGRNLNATLAAWAILAAFSILLWSALPRIALASLPTIALLSGILDIPLQQAHVPLWLAWPTLGLLSAFFSARFYLFSVLPALALCLLLVHYT